MPVAMGRTLHQDLDREINRVTTYPITESVTKAFEKYQAGAPEIKPITADKLKDLILSYIGEAEHSDEMPCAGMDARKVAHTLADFFQWCLYSGKA